jgi:NAD(P)H dehydrogenase (quinone)
MILVTGATGGLGGAVVRQLLARKDASDIAVLARDPAKAAAFAEQGVSVMVGEYGDRDSLSRAMEGVSRVLLIASNEPESRMRQHQNVVEAASEADVQLFGFASRSLKSIERSQNALMRDYFDTEELIRRSGLPAVMFRNALYLDTLPAFLGGPAVYQTGIRIPAGRGAVAYALRREMGEAMANGMLDQSNGDRTYVIAASDAYTFDDVASALGDIHHTSVTYTSTSDEQFVSEATRRGLPEPIARQTVGFFADIRDNQLDETSADLQTLLGRPPASLRDGLGELFPPPAS